MMKAAAARIRQYVSISAGIGFVLSAVLLGGGGGELPKTEAFAHSGVSRGPNAAATAGSQ